MLRLARDEWRSGTQEEVILNHGSTRQWIGGQLLQRQTVANPSNQAIAW